MSSPIRIALVSEGITDFVVIRAAIESMLNDQPYDLKLLQPEASVAFTQGGDAGPLGGGWKGVVKLCGQAASRGGGRLAGDPLFWTYDMLVLHMDADVPGKTSARDREETGVPGEAPCPPATATTDPLREWLLSLAGEVNAPPSTVLCTPAKNTETWVIASLDLDLLLDAGECHPNPEGALQRLPKRNRISKTRASYEAKFSQLRDGWPSVVSTLSEAARFEREFTKAIPPIVLNG